MTKLIFHYNVSEILDAIEDGDIHYSELVSKSLNRLILIAVVSLLIGSLLLLQGGIEQLYFDIGYSLLIVYLMMCFFKIALIERHVQANLETEYELYYSEESYRIKRLEQKNNDLDLFHE
jgi:hypothetical protein